MDHVDPYRIYLASPSPEDAQAGEVAGDTLVDVFQEPRHNASVVAELRRLFGSYRGKIHFGQRHPAASPAWREESVLEGSSAPPRFAIRVHVFERSISAGAGRYLGFVTLRPPEAVRAASPAAQDAVASAESGFAYVLDAELVAPSHMLRPRYHLILTTASSPRLGVLPFRSAAFVAPHPEDTRGSTCMHVAVSQALHLTMGRFGSRPVSQREFDALLWKESDGLRSLSDIAENGARLQEALRVIQKCNAGGFIASFTKALCKNDAAVARREAHRCITDLLANGLAVILAVDYAKLPRSSRSADGKPRYHGALIFGMHLLHSPYEVHCEDMKEIREDFAELPGRFVGHDIADGPFAEWHVCDLLDAAFGLHSPESAEYGIHLLAIGPQGIRLGLHRVRSFAIDLVLSGGGEHQHLYASACGGELPDDPEHWRYVTRLIDLNEVLGRYFADPDERLMAVLAEAFETSADRLENAGYCWSVEARLPQPRLYEGAAEIHPAVVFLWLITDPDEGECPPRAVLRWVAKGEWQVETRRRVERFSSRA